MEIHYILPINNINKITRTIFTHPSIQSSFHLPSSHSFPLSPNSQFTLYSQNMRTIYLTPWIQFFLIDPRPTFPPSSAYRKQSELKREGWMFARVSTDDETMKITNSINAPRFPLSRFTPVINGGWPA